MDFPRRELQLEIMAIANATLLRDYTASQRDHLRSTWLDDQGNKRTDRRGAAPIELAWITTDTALATLVWRPENSSFGWEIQDRS